MISVIVQHHRDDLRPYLDACLWALSQSQGVEFETILISDAKSEDKNAHWLVDRFVHDQRLDSSSKKIAYGASIARGKYVMFLSDDVMLSRGALKALHEGCLATGGIVSPFSQAEPFSGRFAMAPMEITRPGNVSDFGMIGTERKRLTPDMNLEDIDGWHEQIVGMRPDIQIAVRQPWVPFYAPMMSKAVWERVGPLDPDLESRHNDEDWCYRAAAHGIGSFFHLGAPVLHFGSKTLSREYTPEHQERCTAAMLKKYHQGG